MLLSLKGSGDYLSWQANDDNLSFYRIYRAKSKNEPVSRATYLTYVDKGTLTFSDKADDFEGRKPGGNTGIGGLQLTVLGGRVKQQRQ